MTHDSTYHKHPIQPPEPQCFSFGLSKHFERLRPPGSGVDSVFLSSNGGCLQNVAMHGLKNSPEDRGGEVLQLTSTVISSLS